MGFALTIFQSNGSIFYSATKYRFRRYSMHIHTSDTTVYPIEIAHNLSMLCLRRSMWQGVLLKIVPLINVRWAVSNGDLSTWNSVHAELKSRLLMIRLSSAEVIDVKKLHLDSLVQDCSNPIPNALELLESCSKPSIFTFPAQSTFIPCSTPTHNSA